MDFEEPTPKYPYTNLLVRLAGYSERGRLLVEHVQDTTQIEEECRYYRNWHPRNGKDVKGHRQLVARIPPAVAAMLYRRGVPLYGDHSGDSELVKWLNSEEARPWRTSEGTV